MNTLSETLVDSFPYDICVMLASRGRTTSLKSCLASLIDNAQSKSKIQFIITFDRDDYLGIGYFNDVVKHWLDEKLINYSVLITHRYGYAKLNRYYNLMASMAQAEWLLFWADDAIMDTVGWDKQITKFNGKFKILSVISHNEHPYSIFPIVPKTWVQVLGRLTRHNQVDAEISQIAYLLDIFQRIPVYVTHDRADLTGNNKDTTYAEREYKEGNLNDTEDFNYTTYFNKRIQDCQRLAQYMKHIGMDTSWWESCFSGENKTPYAKLEANDPNKQVNTNIPRR